MATEQLGATTYVPKLYTSGSKAAGRFGKHDFLYQPEDNSYQCLGGQKMTYRFTSFEQGKDMQVYWPDECAVCPDKAKCLVGKQRRIKRWVNEDIIDAMLKRLKNVKTEMSLLVLAYNIRSMISIMGARKLIRVIQA